MSQDWYDPQHPCLDATDLREQFCCASPYLCKKHRTCTACQIDPLAYRQVVELLKEWERNIPRVADTTPAEDSLRARTLSALAAAEQP